MISLVTWTRRHAEDLLTADHCWLWGPPVAQSPLTPGDDMVFHEGESHWAHALDTFPTWAGFASCLPCFPGWAAKGRDGPSLPRFFPSSVLLLPYFQWALPEVLWIRPPWHWSASPAAWSALCVPLTSAALSLSKSPCTSPSTWSLMVSPPLRMPPLPLPREECFRVGRENIDKPGSPVTY